MMEHTTDRLFWTLSAIIVAALLLTLSVKAFPKATQQAIAPMTGLMKQADKATSGININVGSIESGDNNNGNTTDTPNNDNSNNMGNVTNSTGPDDGLIGQVQQQNDQSTRANMSLANYQVQLNTATSQISSLQQQLQAIQNNPTNSSVSAQAITDLSSRLQALNATVSSNQDTFQNQINQVMQSSNDKTSAIQSILQTLQNNQSGNTNDINNLNNLLNQANTQLGYTVQYQSFILPNNDLNTVTKQGIYSIAGTYPNINGPIYGRLVVYNDTRNNQQNIERVIYTNQGDIYINSTDWWGNSDFKKIANTSDLQQVQNNATKNTIANINNVLTDGKDMNTVNVPGTYNINNVQTLKNLPSGFSPLYQPVLVVKAGDSVAQLIFDNGALYYRTIGVSNPWVNQWQKIDSNNAGTIKNRMSSYTTDFNNLTDSGVYPMEYQWSTDFQNGPNYDGTGPSYGRAGGIQVTVKHTGDTITQTVLTTNGLYTRYNYEGGWTGWSKVITDSDINNINNKISQMQAQIATLQSHDVYNITPINDSTNLSKLKTPGTYTYSVGNGNSKGIWNLTGAGNMGDALSGLDNSGGFDNNYATIIVSPSLGTWQTQTLIGANGITMIRSMNNGQDFDANIDSRCQWHIVSGNDQSTMMYRGDVSNGDLNNLTETGMYSTHGIAKNAPNSWDWDSTIEVINNKNGLIIQRDTMQDSDSHTPNQQRMFQRLCINGTWQGWTQINSDIQSKVITNSDNILDTFYMPDGSYHVQGAFTNTPFGFSGYGTLVKKTLGDPNSWPDISLTLYDSNGAVYTNQYGFNTWQGWKNSNAQVTTIPSGADLNNYTTTGIYQSYNVQVNNSPYSYTLWFQLSVQQGAAFTTQTLTSSWGQVWTRTLSGWPQIWNGWTQTSNGH